MSQEALQSVSQHSKFLVRYSICGLGRSLALPESPRPYRTMIPAAEGGALTKERIIQRNLGAPGTRSHAE